MESLETQLATARAALAAADKAHQDAALAAVEGGTEEAMQLKQARKAQEAAAAKVEALEAATVAADRREQERLAAEAAEVARMEQAALNAALGEVRTAAAAWDAAFSALSASSDQLQEAARKMQGVPGPADVHSRLESALPWRSTSSKKDGAPWRAACSLAVSQGCWTGCRRRSTEQPAGGADSN